MAEAEVELPPKNTRYYCHQCNCEINPTLPDFVCPRCDSGFVEQLPDQPSQEDELEHDAAEHFADTWDYLHFGGLGGSRLGRARQQRRRTRSSPRIVSFSASMPHGSSVSHPGGSDHSELGHSNPSSAIDMFIQQLFSNLGVTVVTRDGTTMAGFPFGPAGSGSLGDYAWGPNGLDNIITQLLNQLDNSGPPPAEKTRIASLPKVKISQKDVDDALECAVCKESYSKGEEVRKLPCSHLFHNDCVVPWLEMHDSCPVCRSGLNGQTYEET